MGPAPASSAVLSTECAIRTYSHTAPPLRSTCWPRCCGQDRWLCRFGACRCFRRSTAESWPAQQAPPVSAQRVDTATLRRRRRPRWVGLALPSGIAASMPSTTACKRQQAYMPRGHLLRQCLVRSTPLSVDSRCHRGDMTAVAAHAAEDLWDADFTAAVPQPGPGRFAQQSAAADSQDRSASAKGQKRQASGASVTGRKPSAKRPRVIHRGGQPRPGAENETSCSALLSSTDHVVHCS